MNPDEPRLALSVADATGTRRMDHAAAGTALGAHAAAVRARPHQSVAARRRDRRPCAASRSSTAASRSDATKRPGSRSSTGCSTAGRCCGMVCTHFHPDHFGLAHWLTTGGEPRRAGSAPLWMTATEYATGRLLSIGGGGVSGDGAAEHFQRNGLHRWRCAGEGAGARRRLLPEAGAGGAAGLPAAARRRRDRDRPGARAARVPHHRRLRPLARARVAATARRTAC